MPRNLPQRRSNSTKLPNKRPSSHFRHRSFGEVVPVGSLEEDPVGIASKFNSQLVSSVKLTCTHWRRALLVVTTLLCGL